MAKTKVIKAEVTKLAPKLPAVSARKRWDVWLAHADGWEWEDGDFIHKAEAEAFATRHDGMYACIVEINLPAIP